MLAIAMMIPALTGAASQSFSVADGSAKLGMLMSASPNAGVAEPASDKTAASLIGVLAPPEENSFSSSGDVNVKTDGVANTLVSTLNGDIKVGDRIATSSLVGVGAKATGSSWIVGIAQGSLDSKTAGAQLTAVTDSDGKSHQVYVASIPVVVKVTYYNVASPVSDSGLVPKSLQDAADRLAGKHVKLAAIVASVIVLMIGVILAGMLVNGAIRSGFSAIARQPLIKGIILGEIWQAFGMAAGIILVVMGASYLILRLF